MRKSSLRLFIKLNAFKVSSKLPGPRLSTPEKYSQMSLKLKILAGFFIVAIYQLTLLLKILLYHSITNINSHQGGVVDI